VLESVILKDVSFEGDAQVIGMRGKRKHVCDFTATINWTINCTSNADKPKTEKANNTEQEISNMEISKDDNKTNSSVENKDENVLKMIVRDITSDGDYEFENVFPRISTTFNSNEKSALVNHVKLLQKSVIETLRNFLDAFSLK
jgi:translation initiation factor 2 beta subunit (eIF-2beta)/eIF-5